MLTLKMGSLHLVSLLVVVILAHPQIISAEKILFILPLTTRSETHLFIPLARELALKGHMITFVAPIASDIKLPNFKEIIPIVPLDMGDFDKASNPIESRRRGQNKLKWITSFDFQFIFDGCHAVFNNTEFQSLYREQFDLLIFSAHFNNCFEGLVHKFQVPFVTMSSLPVSGTIAQMTGIRMPPSFTPNSFLEYTDDMTFPQRVVNTIMTWIFQFLTTSVLNPANTKIYRQYLGKDYPELGEIESKVSIVFSNSFFSMNNPRVTLPDMVEVGGMHCRGAEPLPQELDEWLSSSMDGFIFFSLGSVVKGVTLPEETRKMFLNVFSRLKQKVLWKWETGEMADLPSNVRLEKWLPQQDVLGHKNIKLFISHGGLLSTQESTFHGVPMIGIPIFVDQDVNMLRAKKMGFCLTLEIMELTEEKLENSIQYVLKNSTYTDNARKAARMFRDRIESPLKTAVYWTEYVLKYNGAPHLRSAARSLTAFQYHSLDVILFLMAIFLLFISVMSLIIIKLFKCNCGRKSSHDYILAKKWQ